MELLIALTLATVVLAGVVGFLLASVRWTDRTSARAEALELVRTVWVVLDEEIRPGLPGRDWRLTSDRAVELRAFRGVGRVCGLEGGRWAVAYRGIRAPDPNRDSLLVLGRDGGWRGALLEGAWTGGVGCELDPGESARLLTWTGGGDEEPVLVRSFESGRYSLEEGAFRYRRGAGGRQPLTPERVGPSSRFEAEAPGIRVRLEVRGWGAVPPTEPFDWLVSPAERGLP